MGEVRIIGGRYRGRKLLFPDSAQLRPTPNRIRETLFNWLAPIIQGARCLDLFAGSGALSFEAISRGADYCLMLESCNEVYAQLLVNRQRFGLTSLEAQLATFPYPTTIGLLPFDIIFIDPPFNQDYLPKVFNWLEEFTCMRTGTLLYVECEKNTELVLPQDWRIIKDKRAGNVRYLLITRP